MANIQKFKEVMGGGVRSNQFSVTMSAPETVSGVKSELITFLCHSASLPGSSIGTAQAYHRGRMVPLAGERQFNPWTITVYADQGMEIRTAFEKWSNYMNDYMNNSGETTPINYKTDQLYVTLLDRNSHGIKSYRLMGAFPTEISDVQLSWQANDQLAEFSITFTFDSMDVNASHQIPSGIGEDRPNATDFEI